MRAESEMSVRGSLNKQSESLTLCQSLLLRGIVSHLRVTMITADNGTIGDHRSSLISAGGKRVTMAVTVIVVADEKQTQTVSQSVTGTDGST